MGINRYNGNFILLVFLSFITGLISLALFTKTLPLLASKTLYFCQQFVSNTLFQIPNILLNTMTMILAVAMLLGILSFLIQLWKTQRLVKRLLVKRIDISKRIEKILTPLDLINKVYVVKDPNLFSFCTGLISSRIIVTTGLISSLNDKELQAVFLHEQSHLQNYDPLKVLLGKTLASMFFFLPIFSELNKNMNAASEMLADRFAMDVQLEATYLKTALKKILATPNVRFANVPAIASSDYLEIRIHRLVNPAAGRVFRISWMSIGTSMVFLFLMMFLLQTPVSAFHVEDPKEQVYFMCSSNNACSQECQKASQTSNLSSPEQLFSPMQQEANNFSSPSQTPKTQPLKYN